MYIFIKTIITTKKIELLVKKSLAIITLNLNKINFVIYIITFASLH